MSLFKSRDWWRTQTAEDLEYDIHSLVVDSLGQDEAHQQVGYIAMDGSITMIALYLYFQ